MTSWRAPSMFVCIATLIVLIGRADAATALVTVNNPADVERPNETIEVPWPALAQILVGAKPDRVIVKDAAGETIVCQPIFLHGQKSPADQLLFQTDLAAHAQATFSVQAGTPEPYVPKVYGRWVPERYDDFAWENDRIAYRAYGPELAKVEPAGGGIDVWPKRTRALVINQWYQLAQSINSGYYHTDHGQGLDCYHTTGGQGCGGTALFQNGKRYTTGKEGWITQKVLANGPIRLIFELTYHPIDVNGIAITETKRVTLDAGQNLNQYESTFTADKPAEDVQVLCGVVEHPDRTGEKSLHGDEGWLSYSDQGDADGEKKPTADKYSGHVFTAVVMPARQVSQTLEIEHNAELAVKLAPGLPLRFLAGAGWDKSGDFADYAAWNAYVATWARRLAMPVTIDVAAGG